MKSLAVVSCLGIFWPTLAMGISACGNRGAKGDADTLPGDATTGAQSGGSTTFISQADLAGKCPPSQARLSRAFPDAPITGTTQGSGFAPTLTGGDLADGTYYLVERTMRGSGNVPSQVSSVLLLRAMNLTYLESHISPKGFVESASAGPVTLRDGALDTSAMQPCWGSEFLPSLFDYGVTGDDVVLRLGGLDYTYRRATSAPTPAVVAGTSPTTACEWFAGDNCWKKSVVAAYACVPKNQGTFNAARTVCTLEDGATVTFAKPVPATPVIDTDFTIAKDGKTCVHFAVTSGKVTILETSLGTYRMQNDSPWPGLASTFCPDGSAVTLQPASLQDCDYKLQPGLESQTTSAKFSYSLEPSQAQISYPDLFNCKLP